MGHPLELSIIENNFIEDWINQNYLHYSETIAFKGHIMTNKKQHLDPSKKWTSSILIITIYHIIIFSDGKDLSKKVPKEYHIYDCKKLTNKEDYVLSMTFQRGKQKSKVIMKTEQMNYIVSLIRRLRFQLDTDHCSNELKLNVKQFLKQPLERKEFTNFEGFLDLYKGWCSYFTVEPSQSIIDYIHKIIIAGCKEIDLNEIETSEQSELIFDPVPFLYTLKHNNFFNSLILKDLKKDLSTKALSDVILHNSNIKKLILKKSASDSLQSIFISISSNKKNSIQILDISDNQLSNKSIASLLFCLTNFNHSLCYLNLSNCGIPPKMMASLFDSFEKNYGMSMTLEYLNISGNKLDEQGNNALTSWIIKSRSFLSLKNLLLSAVGVSSQTLYSIRNLPKLEYLDLSFNKIELTEIERLSHILSISTLYRIDCNYCNLSKEILSLIFSKMSEKKLNVHIELAGLNLGLTQEESNWDMLYTNMALFKETPIKIKTLNLKHIRGTEKTLISMLNVLSEMKIDDLILDSLQLYNPQITGNGNGNSGSNGNGGSNSSNSGSGGNGNGGSSGNSNAGGSVIGNALLLNGNLSLNGSGGSVSNSNSPLNSPFSNYSPAGSNQKDHDDLDDDIIPSSYLTQSSMSNNINNNNNNTVISSSLSVASTLSVHSNYSNSSSSSSSSIYSTANSSFISGGGGSNISLLSSSSSLNTSINGVNGGSSNGNTNNNNSNMTSSTSNNNFQIKNGTGSINGGTGNNIFNQQQLQIISNDLIVSNNKPFKHLFLKSLAKIYNNPEIRFLGLSEIGKIITSFIPTIGKSGSNSSVISLDISGNGIGDHGANLLATALSNNRSLLSINIDSNHITNVGWSTIARSISTPIDMNCSYDILFNSAKEIQQLPSTASPSCLCSMNFPKFDFERLISNSEDIQQRTSIYLTIANLQMALQRNGSILLKGDIGDTNSLTSSIAAKRTSTHRTMASIPVGYLFKRIIEQEKSLIPTTPSILYPTTPIPPLITAQLTEKISLQLDTSPNQSALYSIIATLRDPYYRSTPAQSSVVIQYTNNLLLPTRNSPIPFILSFPDQDNDQDEGESDTSSTTSSGSSGHHHHHKQHGSVGTSFYNQYYQNINNNNNSGGGGSSSSSSSNGGSPTNSANGSPSISILNRNNSPSMIKKLSTSDFYIHDAINKLDSAIQETIVTNSPNITNIKHIKNLDLLEKEKERLKQITDLNSSNGCSKSSTYNSNSRSPLITSSKPRGISKSYIEEGSTSSNNRKSLSASTFSTLNSTTTTTTTSTTTSTTTINNDSTFTSTVTVNPTRSRSSSVFTNPIAIIQNRINT